MMNLLKELHDRSLDHLEALRFSKRDEFSRTIVALYCAVIEQSWSLMLIANEGREAGTSPILRSILEAHVDIANLLANPDYLKHLKAAQHKEWLKLLNEGATGQNPFLAGMSSVADLQSEIAQHKAKLAELEAENFPPLTRLEAFKRVGMEQVYRSIYGHLCRASHNNINALIGSHFELAGEDDFKVVIYRDLKPADFEVKLDTAAGTLIGSGLWVHRHFGSPAATELEALQDKLIAYRKAQGWID